MKRTPIDKLGKFGLIDHITRQFKTRNSSTAASPGDDSSVIDNRGLLTLVSTDLLLEGIHFNLIYTPLKHLGYKSVIRAISDIYAMNGIPGQVLIALGLSKRISVEQVEEIYDGMFLACEKYNIDLAGGDTTSSLTGLTIGVTSTGSVKKENLVTRKGAGLNDLICVTGDLGASYMGLQLLERESRLFAREKDVQPDLTGHEYIIGRQLKPEFPHMVLKEISEAGIKPTSMIDITDGLVSDLLHICKRSERGSRVFLDKVPVARETGIMASEFNIDPLTPALNGGEDYELLFTVPLDQHEAVGRLSQVSIIGHMTDAASGNYLITGNGSEIEMKAQGWERQE